MSASHSEKLAAASGVPKEVMDQINASMPPDMCAPGAAFLAHQSCPLNGEVLRVGLGSVARIAVVHSQGIAKSELTAEDIAENIDSIMDLTDPTVAQAVKVAE
jgi:hypothetical protein